MITQLRTLLNTQNHFFLPAIRDYAAKPTPEKWAKVAEWSRNVHGLIKLGVRSVLDVDDERVVAIAPSLNDIFGLLSERATMISPILSGPPMAENEMREWARKYWKLVLDLEVKLKNVEKYMSANFQ